MRGVHNYHPRHLLQALDFVQRCRGVYPFKDIVDARFKLDELDSAFEKAAARQVLRAASTAWFTSSSPTQGTSASRSPVEGLIETRLLPVTPGSYSPPM